MGKSDPDADRYRHQSMVLVPMDPPGVLSSGTLPVFGYQRPARPLRARLRARPRAGHQPAGGEGGGFAIAQARLGPGRIHHCMRAIGMAERALALMVHRAVRRTAFGTTLADQGVVRERSPSRASRSTRRGCTSARPPGSSTGRRQGGAPRSPGSRSRPRPWPPGDRPRHPGPRRRRRQRRLPARRVVRRARGCASPTARTTCTPPRDRAPGTAPRAPVHRLTGGMSVADGPLSGCEELRDRRAAVAELGAELRALADLVTRTEARGAYSARVRDGAGTGPGLARAHPGRCGGASVDDLMGRVRMFNPVIGPGNPIAPPMAIESVRTAPRAGARSAAYEGPPMYGHGGVSAMLLDQLLGHAAAVSGHPGVTTELSVRYRRPVPLDVPLRIWGRVVEAEERRVAVVGGITTAAEPDIPLVEAEGGSPGSARTRPGACSASGEPRRCQPRRSARLTPSRTALAHPVARWRSAGPAWAARGMRLLPASCLTGTRTAKCGRPARNRYAVSVPPACLGYWSVTGA